MAWASLIVAILAVIVAGVALYFYFPAENRAKRAEEREEAAERRALAAESRVEAQDRRAEIEAQTTRMGRLTTDLLGPEPGPVRAYRFRVTNIGKAAIWDLIPTLLDSSGKLVSEPLPTTYLNSLQSRERQEFVIEVTDSVDRSPLFLRYEWGDDYSNREYVSGVEVPKT